MVPTINRPLSIRLFRSRLICLCCFLLTISFSAWAQTPTLDSEEQAVLKLINDYRAQNGLNLLRASLALTRAADWMSADMAAKNYFNHADSAGRDPFVRMTAFGYNYGGYRGENIAAGYSDAARTFNLWRNSPGHNAAMLNANFNVIGISRAYGASSTYKWYWTTDFGSFVDVVLDTGDGVTQMARTVNAANYVQTIAPDSLAATFGNQLSSTTARATSLPLPLMLAGVAVIVNNLSAPLLYVSPTQVNYLVPANVDPGTAVIKVMNGANVIANGTVVIENLSPSIFTVTANGKGVPAAQTTFDGVAFQSVANADDSTRALGVGTAAKPNYLVLYGTGLRRRSSMSNVRATIGGVQAEITFLGAHSRLAGLDQINIKLPQELRGRGNVDVVVTIDGKTANTVTINLGN
ncbi:MAG: CAP domain-containing protein [Acidobacteriota bacterium]|nr:CAP domain-containing protein [Acidobacteriota bacterium]